MKKRKNNLAFFILFLVLIFIVAVFIGILVMPSNAKVNKKDVKINTDLNFSTKNWLSKIDDNVKINKINIPGSHDSAAYNIPMSFKARCQEEDITKQLNMGIRYLDVRLKNEKNGLVLSHGPITCFNNNREKYFFKDLLRECYNFIVNNKSEFIILNIKNERIKTTLNEFNEEIKKDINFIICNKEKLYLEKDIPKLKDVRGKIIILRRYDGEDFFGNTLMWENQSKTELDTNLYKKNINGEKVKVFSQDQFKLNKKEKIKAIDSFINMHNYQENSYNINFLSCSGKLFDSPKKFVDCFEYDDKNFKRLEKALGQIIVYDFVNNERTKYIIKTNSAHFK